MRNGICECGCGQLTTIATKTYSRLGQVKGQPLRFVHNHHRPTLKHGCGCRTGATAEYVAFKAARQRCNNPNIRHWKYYGGRGIKFLFTSFDAFFAELGPKPTPQHSVDRIDNDGNYEPGNVKWSTNSEQQMNKRRKQMLCTA
jgi:hypothetical protein